MEVFVNRMIRAAQLDVELYEEVEHDREALPQAAGVIVLSSVAAGLGRVGLYGINGVILGSIGALIAWLIWAYLTYLIGTKLLPEPGTYADMGEMLRTIGFSSSPGVIRILGFIPVLGRFIIFAASVWMLVAMVIAVRQALDYESTLRALGVCMIGWLVQVLLLASLIFLVPPIQG